MTGVDARIESREQLRADIRAFADDHGRRPRVLVARAGQDDAHALATAFADLGFDVDIGPPHQAPQACVRQAIENDVHALAVGDAALVAATVVELKAQGADDIAVFVGAPASRASARDVLEQIRQTHKA